MSETPRTDAGLHLPADCSDCVPAQLARQLERELAAAEQRVARLEEALRDCALEGIDLNMATCHSVLISAEDCARCSSVLAARTLLAEGRK